MGNTVHCDIVSAESAIFSGAVEMLIAEGSLGELGITPGHTALLTDLKPGPIRLILEGGEEQLFFLSGGFVEVQPKTITVLADTALRAADLDEAAAVAAQEAAEKTLSDQHADFDYSSARAQLAEAVAQLRTLRKLRR